MLSTIAFAVYMGVVMGFSMGELYEEDLSKGVPGTVDWLFLVIMPLLGTVMNRTIFGTWQSDGYTKKLALLRVYPIPVGVIVGTRIVQSLLLVVVNTAVVLSLEYTLAPELRNAVSGGDWIEFGVLLAGYSLIVNLAFIWLEMGHSGKRYVQGCFAWIALVTIGVVLAALADVEDYAYEAALRWTASEASLWIWPSALLASAIAVSVGYRIIVRRVGSRSASF